MFAMHECYTNRAAVSGAAAALAVRAVIVHDW
jgi:hypothetical protein